MNGFALTSVWARLNEKVANRNTCPFLMSPFPYNGYFRLA